MREILFRGKRKDNGEWIEGFPVRIYDYGGLVWDMHPFNTNLYCTEAAIPSTICQFTGLTDKHEKKIFEGDIVRYGEVAKHPESFEVVWSNSHAAWMIKHPDTPPVLSMAGFHLMVEVIGNIHDNPELLEENNDVSN